MNIVMMLKDERNETPDCCCADMHNALEHAEFPMHYSGAFDEFGMRLSSAYEYAVLRHCPWCARPLPRSRRDDWFDRLESLGMDPWQDDIPEAFRSAAWRSET